jgi:hypothetical protein
MRLLFRTRRNSTAPTPARSGSAGVAAGGVASPTGAAPSPAGSMKLMTYPGSVTPARPIAETLKKMNGPSLRGSERADGVKVVIQLARVVGQGARHRRPARQAGDFVERGQFFPLGTPWLPPRLGALVTAFDKSTPPTV